jgi:hypothetical protein
MRNHLPQQMIAVSTLLPLPQELVLALEQVLVLALALAQVPVLALALALVPGLALVLVLGLALVPGRHKQPTTHPTIPLASPKLLSFVFYSFLLLISNYIGPKLCGNFFSDRHHLLNC